MNKNNLHKVFYKEYFSAVKLSKNDDEEASIAAVNQKIINTEFFYIPFPSIEKVTKPQLKVQYPGLVTGIGIDHEVGIKGEFKLGMHFDWTYGMPVIYGSSVKGVLRAWFTEFYQGDIDAIDLMMDIFSGVYGRDTDAEKKKYGEDLEEKVKEPQNRIYTYSKPIYERDIFFDAVIRSRDNKGRILCSDSITPHGDDPLKNPTPISFLKIAPGCNIEFRFRLTDSNINGKIFNAQQKLKLFRQILTTVGIGAKTNVGYGQLSE